MNSSVKLPRWIQLLVFEYSSFLKLLNNINVWRGSKAASPIRYNAERDDRRSSNVKLSYASGNLLKQKAPHSELTYTIAYENEVRPSSEPRLVTREPISPSCEMCPPGRKNCWMVHWPPRSPDRDPLEYYVWDDLAQTVKGDTAISQHTLIVALKHIVHEISQDVVSEICPPWNNRLYWLSEDKRT